MPLRRLGRVRGVSKHEGHDTGRVAERTCLHSGPRFGPIRTADRIRRASISVPRRSWRHFDVVLSACTRRYFFAPEDRQRCPSLSGRNRLIIWSNQICRYLPAGSLQRLWSGRWAAATVLLLGAWHVALGSAGSEPMTCPSGPPEEFRIMLDVGHTPRQPGAISARGAREYDFNARLAARISEELAIAGFRSTRVLKIDELGRKGLFRRPREAEKWGANLLLSIHHDSVQPHYLKSWAYEGKPRQYSDDFRGFSLFVSKESPSYGESLRFATLLADQLISRGMSFTLHHAEDISGERRELLDPSRGVYRFDGLIVLRRSKMPAVLLEAGVIVNRDEELQLASPQRRDIIAAAVTAAATEYCASASARR
jgi:N-acetylmuramoyl-L-alanine amidase